MFANSMTALLNKCERRLGTAQLNLPEYLQKPHWVDIIKEDSLITFSRYFPDEKIYKLIPGVDKEDENGYFIIDEDRLGKDIAILGAKDIDWEGFSKTYNYYATGAYNYNTFGDAFTLDSVASAQMAADHNSLFNNGIYVDFRYPNRIKIVTVADIQVLKGISIPIILYTVHPANLTTISPTQMGIFEELVFSDVATWLYNELKYYDQLETVYSNIELRLDYLQNIAERREDVIGRLDDGHTTSANAAAPYMFTF